MTKDRKVRRHGPALSFTRSACVCVCVDLSRLSAIQYNKYRPISNRQVKGQSGTALFICIRLHTHLGTRVRIRLGPLETRIPSIHIDVLHTGFSSNDKICNAEAEDWTLNLLLSPKKEKATHSHLGSRNKSRTHYFTLHFPPHTSHHPSCPPRSNFSAKKKQKHLLGVSCVTAHPKPKNNVQLCLRT